jgi:carbon-monoxide dehydrogenase medium subunit
MKPVAFSYSRPATVDDARLSLTRENAIPIAGNQSLGPMLNLRLARPTELVDLATLGTLRRTEETETLVRFGAGVTHAEIEDGDVPDPTGNWLQQVAGNIAHRAVRNRGTLGGSLCHADPSADWVIVMTALDAAGVVEGPSGQRRISIENFITGPYETVLAESEILIAVEVTKPGPHARWGYWKFARQVGEFAKASAAVFVDPANGTRRIVIGALGRQPLVLPNPGSVLAGSLAPGDALSVAMPDRPRLSLGLHCVALTRALAQIAPEPNNRADGVSG